MQDIIINEQTAGGRLDKTIMKYLDKAPSGFVYKMLRKKNILLNEKRAKGSELLADGDVIRLYLADETIQKFRSGLKGKASSAKQNDADGKPGSARLKQKRTAEDNLLRNMIVYEDEQILVINKPAGMLSQKSNPSDVSVNDLLVRYLGRTELFTPGISNRLDRNTSGLMLAGKHPQAVRLLNAAIRDRDLKKLYLCPVVGRVTGSGEIEGYLKKDNDTNMVRVYEELPADADRNAYSMIRTSWETVSSNERYSLLQVDLITGRSHQIRAHLASTGHPIIGDPKYGDVRINRYFYQKYGLSCQLLHAWQIRFCSMKGVLEPLNGSYVTGELPAVFQRILEQEGLFTDNLSISGKNR